jgi:hypothetical protein
VTHASKTIIAVEESFAAWRKDREYVKAYDGLEDEFSLVAATIKAVRMGDLTQEQTTLVI